jgi:N-acetylmuramoyl-L-alanine amidase
LLTKYKRFDATLTKVPDFPAQGWLIGMNRLFLALPRGLRAIWLIAALAAAGLSGAAAQPVPVPAPRTPPSASDPLGALLAQQGLATGRTAVPMVIGLKIVEIGGRSRFMMELSDPVDVRVFTLTSPNRVVFDMPELLWRVSGEPRPSGKGPVKSYRYGLFRKGNFRFVVDLAAPVRVDKTQVLPPEGGSGFRLVVDLAPTTTSEFLAHAGWPKDVSAAMASFESPPAPAPATRSGKRLIILDPGHGGIDPGTHGQSGLVEKDLVLSVAKTLRKALESTGRYRVQLTRDTDVFIPLRERVNIARAAHGDLFVSLHADSNDHRDVRGASVYTLSEDASDREAATLAEKENMSDIVAGVDLTGENSPVASILIDLAQRDTMNRSVRFAEAVIGSLPAATQLRPLFPHRSAGFAVLKGPDIPAVLIELGYLTNLKDESEMATEAWRTRVARAISSAIDTHFAGEVGLGLRQANR